MLDPATKTKQVEFNERDFKVEWYSGTGAGGQHRNKHQNSCRLTHYESGIVITAQCRSRENSLNEAKETMLARLNNSANSESRRERDEERKQQVGSGMRGDKVRTYREQDDTVTDHQTGKRASLKSILIGDLTKVL